MRYLTFILLAGCTYAGDCEVPFIYNYVEPPHAIEFCTDTRIDKMRVVEQFQWWHNEISSDYPWFTYDDTRLVICDEEPHEPGVIRISGADLGFMIKNLAAAYTGYEIDSTVVVESTENSTTYNTELIMDGATIYLKPWNTNRVIRHEIGHAFGWDHVEGDHHLMSPTTGSETCGLEQWELF